MNITLKDVRSRWGGSSPKYDNVIEVRVEHTGNRRWGFIRPWYVKCG
jgi:hypothetical protein